MSFGGLAKRLPRSLPAGLDGLPIATPAEERVSRGLAIAATVWFTLAAAWELFGPILAGHYAAAAGMGIIGENMLRWRILGPVWEYTTTRPGPDAYYCHHPFGTFWTTAIFLKLFGRHDFVCRLPAVVLSAVTPPLLYAIGRSVWRPAAGAAAAAAFVVLPITLAFAQFNALEVPVTAWSLLFAWGLVRLAQTGRRRFLIASVSGAVLAMHADWPAFLFVGAVLAFGLVRGFLAPRLFGARPPRRWFVGWALTASAAVLTLVFYLALFGKAGKLGDLFGIYGARSSGSSAPLAKVLVERRTWIDLSFTPLAIFLGKVGACVSLLRLVILRREHEVLPLALLWMATVQYVVFKQGADIHVFWPHYFGAYFALAMGALAATVASIAATASAWIRRGPPRAEAGWAVALVVALLPLLLVLRDGVTALAYARATGGRFNEKGLIIDSDGDKTAFLAWLRPDLPPDKIVDMHEGMKSTWAQVWTLGGLIVSANRAVPQGPATDGRETWLADTRFLPDDAQTELARRFHVVAVGPFWKISRGEPAAPIDAFGFVEREPTLWEWYFVSGTEPVRQIAPDPWLTWELCTHFAQPASIPTAEARTLDERRIQHNIALAAGDQPRADAIARAIEAELRPIHGRFEDGTEIVGVTYQDGARPLLTLILRAAGPAANDFTVAVRSRVVLRAPLSTTPLDPVEREVGLPLGLSPRRWRAGFLYADPVPIRKRPGTEVFRASLVPRGRGPAPRLVGGESSVEVLRVP